MPSCSGCVNLNIVGQFFEEFCSLLVLTVDSLVAMALELPEFASCSFIMYAEAICSDAFKRNLCEVEINSMGSIVCSKGSSVHPFMA